MGDLEAKQDLGRLAHLCTVEHQRFLRNVNRYYNNRFRRNTLDMLYDVTAAWYSNEIAGPDTCDMYTTYNIIKSIVDTVCSKISQTKVRPHFTPANGTFKTRKVCEDAQKFFDIYYDSQKVYTKAALAFRDSCLMTRGVLWIDDDDYSIKRVPTFQFYMSPFEYQSGCITKCAYVNDYYSKSALKGQVDKSFYNELGNTVRFAILWDLEDGVKYYFVNGNVVNTKTIKYSVMPFELIYWCDPINGYFSTSCADDLYNLQLRIDRFIKYVTDAAAKGIKHSYLTPEQGGLKASKVLADHTQIMTYNAAPGNNPIQVVTPPIISDQYLTVLDKWIGYGYNLIGMSELSAQSKKPRGVTSAIQLDTLQDVESERFNVMQKNYINLQKNIATKMMDIFPAGERIIEDERGTGAKWGDLVKARNDYKIQYTSASALSKDPSEKLDQIQALMGMGFIDKSTASILLEMPDLEKAYSIINICYEYVETIIERALDGTIKFQSVPNPNVQAMPGGVSPEDLQIVKGQIYEVVDLDLLKRRAAYYIMSLDIDGAKSEEIDALVNLFKYCVQIQGEAQSAIQQLNAPMMPAGPQQGQDVGGGMMPGGAMAGQAAGAQGAQQDQQFGGIQ